jgi:glutathione S-transferase
MLHARNNYSFIVRSLCFRRRPNGSGPGVSSRARRLWRAERFADAACIGSVEQSAAIQLASDFAYIDRQIANKKWVTGADFSVADLHLFVFGRLGLRVAPSTRDFPNFYRHTLSIAGLAATMSAIAQEGITFEGPKSGPG